MASVLQQLYCVLAVSMSLFFYILKKWFIYVSKYCGMKIKMYQTCVNKDLHVHQIPDTLIVEYKNSLQDNDIWGIDLSIYYKGQLYSETSRKTNK